MNDSDVKSAHSQTIGLLSRSRAIALIAGIVFLVLGVVFALRPTGAIRLFAVLVALAIFCFGFLEVADAIADRGTPHWGWSLLRGLFHFVVGGILVFWPEVTATVIAILLGIDLILDGCMAFLVRHRMPDGWSGRGLLALRGVVEIAIGIVVLVWPKQTLVVITWLFAAYLIVLGLVLLLAAKRLSDARRAEAAA